MGMHAKILQQYSVEHKTQPRMGIGEANTLKRIIPNYINAIKLQYFSTCIWTAMKPAIGAARRIIPYIAVQMHHDHDCGLVEPSMHASRSADSPWHKNTSNFAQNNPWCQIITSKVSPWTSASTSPAKVFPLIIRFHVIMKLNLVWCVFPLSQHNCFPSCLQR